MADVRLGDAVTTGGPSRRILAVLVIEFLLIVGGITSAAVFASSTTPHSGLTAKIFFWQDSAASDAGDRANAVSVARQFVLNSDAFNPANLKGYLANLMPLMTTKAQTALTSQYADFNQVAGSLLNQIAKSSKTAGQSAKGSIEFAALSAFSGTTATVIVAHDVVYPQTTAQTYRWSISMRKVGNSWLVDSFNPSV
ncbi:MAG: hypothetical protein ACTHJM_13115 [Marmoricola sp.]